MLRDLVRLDRFGSDYNWLSRGKEKREGSRKEFIPQDQGNMHTEYVFYSNIHQVHHISPS